MALGIFLANVIGALAMGIFLGRIEVIDRVPPYVTAFVATGFLGGMTTFSTFADEAVTGVRAGYRAWHGLHRGHGAGRVGRRPGGMVLTVRLAR